MFLLPKVIHVLALGLWFGTAVFFTFVVGLSLFDTFGKITPEQRPSLWLPLPPELEKAPPTGSFPTPLSKEQGSRLAGAAVGPMFTWYYALQLGCGLAAVLTALAWFGSGGVHRVRVLLLGLAVATVVVGWLLEWKVSRLREARSRTSDVVLRSSSASPAEKEAADAARAEFGRWHGYSLVVNFLTLALVTVAMGMAASLPAAPQDGAAAEPQAAYEAAGRG
jgi:hypothetical protein